MTVITLLFFFSFFLFLVFFLISPRHCPRIFVNPLLCFEKNLALEVAHFFFSLVEKHNNRWNSILLYFAFSIFGFIPFFNYMAWLASGY